MLLSIALVVNCLWEQLSALRHHEKESCQASAGQAQQLMAGGEGQSCLCRVPTLAEAGWDVWERLSALEPADPSRGTNGAGQLETGLAEMSAVLEQRNRLQVALFPAPLE